MVCKVHFFLHLHQNSKNSIKMADKKLVRSANKKIAGVCGGLAEFLGLDASIVRIVWLLCVLLGGFGLLAYLIMWIVMPAQK
jgi:phage shock protein PspC (stress-responsive transcriptional regulator)